MQNQTPVFVKTYDFYKEYCTYSLNFPKTTQMVLGRKIEKTILEVLEYISNAEYTDKKKKMILLNKASIKLDFLKILVRLLNDTKSINQKKYILLEDSLQEIGRMIGGWLKSLK